MEILFILLSIFTQFQRFSCQSLQLMNPEEQIVTMQVIINDQDYQSNEDAFLYSQWSRYTPLIQMAQVGNIGIFDSNCYNYHNFVGKRSKLINLIFYVCLNSYQSTITQTLQFLDDQNKENVVQITLEPDNFENVWFFFQLIQWPMIGKFQLLIKQSDQEIYFKELAIKYPFYDKELIATFGGGADFSFGTQTMEYSYFPGTIIYSIPDTYTLDPSERNEFSYFDVIAIKDSICAINSQTNVLRNTLLKGTQIQTFPSSNSNIDYFQFVGWVKIISQNVDQLFYKAIQITTNSKNNNIMGDNLSPFCLYYKISNSGNQIHVTTYSYDFPSVNNPIIITKEFDVINNLFVWHYIKVTLSNKQLQIEIIFYEDTNYVYQAQIQVQQFHRINFQILIGNVEERIDNYLNIQADEVYYSNCDSLQFSQACHYSCDQCIGPTSSDCSNCKSDSQRSFLPDLNECICPFSSIDDIECRNLQNLNLQVEEILIKQGCQYGYFEVNQECFKCPEIINEKQINCLECLNNPNTWIDKLYCQTYMVSEDSQTFQSYEETQTKYETTIQYYTFDGTNVNFCEKCLSSCIDQQCLFDEYQDIIKYKTITKPKSCEGCQNNNCQKDCAACNGLICAACYPPYYLTSNRLSCKQCSIPNCQYCFEYRQNDLNFNTLEQLFNAFSSNDQNPVELGCALCNEGFNYNFRTGKCVYGQPSIENCGRSYIDLQGIEVCVMSTLNFDIAPQLSGCEQYISNCEQCILTPTKVIKCVLCADGFVVSVLKGDCEICTIENSVKCIQGDMFLYDYWVQSIQSFMMQFLPDNYFYPKPILTYYAISFPLTCTDGYMPNRNYQCKKYCDAECFLCEEVSNEFVCKVCPYNYYGQPILSRNGSQCLKCPQLCYSCTIRSIEEIAQMNAYFKVTQDNLIYTHRCLKSIEEDNIILDSQLQVAKYCFDDQCDGNFQREILIYCNSYEGFDDENYDLYYQNDVSIEFYNQMGMKGFTLTLYFQDISKCVQTLEMETILKSVVFSLQTTLLQLIGLQNSWCQWNEYLSISNFDTIYFKNFNLLVDSEMFISIVNDVLPIDLELINSSFKSTDQSVQLFGFLISVNKNLIISNVTLQQLNLANYSFFEYKSNYDEQIINITQLQIENCNFYNITLFSFLQYAAEINIKQVSIKDTNFFNSTLFKFHESSSSINTINSVIIENCSFTESILFSSNNQHISISNLIISNGTFQQSTVVLSQYYATLKEIFVKQTYFLSSILLLSVKQQQSVLVVQSLSDLYFSEVHFQQSKILEIVSFNYLNIILKNITHSGDYGQNEEYLYDIQCQNVSLTNFMILNTQNLQFIRIYQTNFIVVEGFLYQNLEQFYKIALSDSCFQQSDTKSRLLFIQGFERITINNVSIMNQLAIDMPIIQIQSDLLFQQTAIEVIEISEVSFFGNILLKKNIGSILSLFILYSERTQYIRLNKFSFKENFFHQLIDDSSESITSLMYLNSKLSEISIKNTVCYQNGITNSSNPCISVNSLKIKIDIFLASYCNEISDQIWFKYYQASNINFPQQLMEQLFIINSGGLLSLQSQSISLSNSKFNNIKAFSTSVLNIITSGQGAIQLLNISITQASVTLSQTIEVVGCIRIYSKYSKLNLQIVDLKLEQVYNRLGSAIFSIDPSVQENQISLSNITVIDCFSLLNQIMQIDFSQIQANKNQFKLDKLTFIQTFDGFSKYLQQIIFPSKEEIQKITSDNALLNLQYCSVILTQIYYTGILYSPVFKLNYLTKLVISYLILEDIKVLNPFDLGIISSTQLAKNNLIISDIIIRNISHFETGQLVIPINIQSISFILYNCIIEEIQAVSSNDNILNNLIQLINEQGQQIGSIISIQSLTSVSNLRMRQIKFLNNNCAFCFQGMLQIQVINFPIVNIEDMNCYNNTIQKYGCLFISTEAFLSNLENLMTIKTSVFIYNNGTSGVGIFSQNVLLSVINCLFYRNNGSMYGGAIYFQNLSNDFLFSNTIIIKNYAKIGGGIHLSPENHISENNFKASILLFNKAKLYSDNLVEIPNHLTLIINKKEMPDNTEEINGNEIQHLLLSPYQCINQGNSIETRTLMLPSNQIINNYMLFSLITKNYVPYITELNLVYKNAMNELLQGDSDDICSIILQRESNKSTEITSVLYDSQILGINIGEIQISMDPYKKQQFQILINCSSGNYDNKFNYRIDVTSFQCQLGEFYVDEGCQICDSKQGFYSVTYNTTKCSIFDTSKFENVTSNLIQLKVGYWRPQYDSDLVENCFKNQNWCLGGWSVNDDLCYPGHVGGLCEECDIYNTKGFGRFFKVSNTKCQLCNIAYSWVSFLLISLWSFTSVFITLKSLKNSNRLFLQLKLKTKFFLIVFKYSQDFQSILVKMFLNYLWIFAVIFTFNINFDVSLNFINVASKPTYSMAINLDCLLSEIINIQLSYTRIIAMILFIIIQLIIVVFIQLWISFKDKENYDCSLISNTVIYLFVFNQSSLITMFGSLLAVRTISGINFVQGDVTMQFYNQGHLDWIYLFVLPGLIIWGAFFPLTIFCLLKKGKKQLNQYRFRRHVCYLYNEYIGQKYYWEQIKIWKRSIIIIILVYFESDVTIKALLISFTLLLYQFLAINHEPYITKKLNSYDVRSGQIVSGTIFLAALKFISEQTQSSSLLSQNVFVSIVLQILIFSLCSWLCYYFMVAIMRAYFKKYNFFLLTLLFKVVSKIKKNSKIALYLTDVMNYRKLKQERLQANFDKLRQYLSLTSKFQLEQLRNNSPLTLRSKGHIRLLTELDTQRMLLHSKTIFTPKDMK